MDEVVCCAGCGVRIQTEDATQLGYLPPTAIHHDKPQKRVYCQRCFKLRHYNQFEKTTIEDQHFLSILNEIGLKQALFVHVIDVFDVHGTIIYGLPRFIGSNCLVVVVNKVDLLPRSVNLNKVERWLKQQLADVGIVPDALLLVSSKKRQSVQRVAETIEQLRNGQDVYVVGVTNVGKSTLLNQLFAQLQGEEEVLTVSAFPGTTLDVVRLPLDGNSALCDTPGIIHRQQLAHYLQADALKTATPQKELKPKTYQLQPGQTIFFGGLARVDYVHGARNSLTIYAANSLLLHRTKTITASAFYAKHVGGLLTPPRATDRPLKLVPVEFKVDKRTDVVISGLGWITIQQPGVVVIWAPKEVAVTKRPALI